jgi:hypothetical protein
MRPARRTAGRPGRPPEYCAGRGHTRASAWKERRRLAAEKNGTTISAADDASPVTMAKVGGAELLRSLRNAWRGSWGVKLSRGGRAGLWPGPPGCRQSQTSFT